MNVKHVKERSERKWLEKRNKPKKESLRNKRISNPNFRLTKNTRCRTNKILSRKLFQKTIKHLKYFVAHINSSKHEYSFSFRDI